MLRRYVPLLVLLLSPGIACSGSDDPAATPDTSVDSGLAEVFTDSATVDDTSIDDTSVDSASEDSALPDTATAADSADASDADSASDVSLDAATEAGTSCKSGAVQEESCGKCGTRSRLCDSSKWLEWSGCFGETGTCVPAEKRAVPCGRCGTRNQTCSATCEWDSEACTGEGACVPGSTETSYGACLDTTKVKTRTCSDVCAWTTWSDCK